jgi:hypothetical protein
MDDRNGVTDCCQGSIDTEDQVDIPQAASTSNVLMRPVSTPGIETVQS